MMRKIHIYPLPEQTLLHELFARLQHLNWSMLLESADKSGMDIIVADPIATLETAAGITLIRQGDLQQSHHGDPFTLLAATQQSLLGEVTHVDTSLPFIGGAVGLFGYDLGRYVETLPSIACADIDLPDIAVGIYDWALLRCALTGNWQLVHWGDEAGLHKRMRWLEKQTPIATTPFMLTGPWQSNMSRDSYGQKFQQIQHYLADGDCYQINLAQRFNAPYEGDEWQAYQTLSQANQAPFSAFIRLDNSAILSLSPERFLRLKGRHIETKPIKGTRPRHKNPVEDRAIAKELAQCPKDRAENLMIVDLLRNDIGRVSRLGSVTVPTLFAIESFPAVHHLVSVIHGELAADKQGVDLLRACFPGGSITGAPKIKAMEIIEELEPHRRSAYCGSIGYLSQHGQLDTSITIRTLIAHHNQLYCWAGGGIIADSDVDSEYQETFDKLSRILPLLSQEPQR